MVSGVLPIISRASFPTASTRFSSRETATTEGSFMTTPFRGTKTKVLAVPKSMPIFRINIEIVRSWLLFYSCAHKGNVFFNSRCEQNLIPVTLLKHEQKTIFDQ